MKRALVLDDRQYHLDQVRASLEKEGYAVIETKRLRDAKKEVEKAETEKKPFDLIVSDFDLSGSLLRKHRWFDGYFFVRWLHEKGVKSKAILHSTGFEPSNKLNYWLHRPIIKSAQRMGATVQGKRKLVPNTSSKPR